MWTAHHPAPGMGDLLPGFFVVPQNPLWDNKSRANAPMGFAGGPKYIPHIGELLPGRFAVPQNPLIAAVRKGLAGLGGCCAECSGSNGANPEDAGTGYINGQPIIGGVQSLLEGIDWVTVLVAGGVAYMLMKK